MGAERLPRRVLAVIVAAALTIACVSLSLPDWAHVHGARAQVSMATVTAVVLSLALFTPIDIWRWRVAPGSFRSAHPDPWMTIGWHLFTASAAAGIMTYLCRTFVW